MLELKNAETVSFSRSEITVKSDRQLHISMKDLSVELDMRRRRHLRRVVLNGFSDEQLESFLEKSKDMKEPELMLDLDERDRVLAVNFRDNNDTSTDKIETKNDGSDLSQCRPNELLGF